MHFVERREGTAQVPEPDFGDIAPCQKRYGLEETAPVQFAAERRRGWHEATDSPRPDPQDIFDERRNAKLIKGQPGGALTLGVESVGRPGGQFDGNSVEGLSVRYWLQDGKNRQPIGDLQWADWDARGRLLVATRSGELQIRDVAALRGKTRSEVDLSDLQPLPTPAPHWAERW